MLYKHYWLPYRSTVFPYTTGWIYVAFPVMLNYYITFSSERLNDRKRTDAFADTFARLSACLSERQVTTKVLRQTLFGLYTL